MKAKLYSLFALCLSAAGFSQIPAGYYDGTSGLGRIVTPGSKPSLDWEPEYIAVAKDGKSAMVTLQEANAVAKIDLMSQQIVSVTSLGLKDHSLPGNELDTTDRDITSPRTSIAGNYRNAPVFGMYMPDAIASYASGGKTYYITANEGDSRNLEDFVDGEFNEEVRVGSGSYVLDPTAFPDAAALKADSNLGRLTVTTSGGDLDGDGDYDQIHVFGGRSFSILDENGNQVFDSGSVFEMGRRWGRAVITAFAKRVGTERALTGLYLLTVADIRGTSPKVWNAWKGKLLEDLYKSTLRVLGGRAPDANAEVEARKREALIELARHSEPHEGQKALWDTLDVGYFMRHDGATQSDLVQHAGRDKAQIARIVKALHERNVRVRVLTNSLEATDVGAVHAGYTRYRKALLRGGVQIYELRRESGARPPILRAKPVSWKQIQLASIANWKRFMSRAVWSGNSRAKSQNN